MWLFWLAACGSPSTVDAVDLRPFLDAHARLIADLDTRLQTIETYDASSDPNRCAFGDGNYHYVGLLDTDDVFTGALDVQGMGSSTNGGNNQQFLLDVDEQSVTVDGHELDGAVVIQLQNLVDPDGIEVIAQVDGTLVVDGTSEKMSYGYDATSGSSPIEWGKIGDTSVP